MAYIKGHQFKGKNGRTHHTYLCHHSALSHPGAEFPVGKARSGSQGFLDVLLGPEGMFREDCFSVEQEGLVPGGFTKRKHLDLTIGDTPSGR